MASSAVQWTEQDLAETTRAYVGSGYNQNAEDFAQFCHEAAKIIQKRRAVSPQTLASAPVVFIMAPRPSVDGMSYEERALFDRAKAEISGRIWFGAARLGLGIGIDLPQCDDQQRFQYIIDSLNAGNAPAVYYDAADDAAMMRIYRKGFSVPDEYENLSLDSANLTLSHIKAILDKAHDQFLKTSTASETARKLWQNQSKCFPIKEAEKGIQEVLFIALSSYLGFGPVYVEQEGVSVMGRYDFRLKEQDPIDSTKWTHHAILELKVVKSFTNTGGAVQNSTNLQAVSDGVNQANDYRNDQHCRMAALCCYDMRVSPDPAQAVAHEQQRAATINVELWAWPLYATPKKARNANAGVKKAAKKKKKAKP
jgi:hypothetical protein